jgi:hypothetical protein
METEDIKSFIKDNLIIETHYESQHGSSNNMIISLRFLNDDAAFTKETIYIPDDFEPPI